MAIEHMSVLNVTFPYEVTFDILMKIKQMTAFYPTPVTHLIKDVKHVHMMPRELSLDKLKESLDHLKEVMGFNFVEGQFNNEMIHIERSQNYVNDLLHQIEDIHKIKQELVKTKDENDSSLVILENIEGHEMNLDQLFNSHYLKVRIGRILTKNLTKLEYYDRYPFILQVYKENSDYTWCAYVAVKKDSLEIDNVFSSMGFERIHIPGFVHGTAKEAYNEVKKESLAMDEYIKRMDQKIKVLVEQHRLQLNHLYTQVVALQDLFSLHECIIDYGNHAALVGFVEKQQLEGIKKELETIDDIEVLVLPANIYQNHQVYPPIIYKNNRFIKPFETFLKVTSTDEMDATLLISCLSMIVCGIFAGDILIGMLMSLIGLCFANKANGFKVLNRLGLSVLGCGLLYGTMGYQDIYPSMMALSLPLSVRFIYLIGTLIIGRCVIKSIGTMYKNIKENEYIEAILGKNGLAWLLIFSILIFIVVEKLQFGRNYLTLPFELIVGVALILTMFKNKIKHYTT